MKIDDVLKLKIIDNDINGNGIAKFNDFVIFIPFCLKDEIVKAKVVKINRRYAFGELIEVISKVDKRCDVICPYYRSCGGCNFLHTTFENENKIKLSVLKRLFEREVEYINSDISLNYRNKATFHVKYGNVCYYNNESHDVCVINECKIVDEKINVLLKELAKIDLNGVNELSVRVLKNKVMINIYCDENYDISLLNEISCDSLYVNDKLYSGEQYLIDEVNGLRFSVFPNAFYQVNREGMNKIYNKASEYSVKGDKLLDLYCGTGTIGIWLSSKFNEVIGCDINESSIRNALINKKLNNISNISFICEDAKEIEGKYDVIVVDPPRSGLSKNVIEFLDNSKCKRIVYISCNPFTLKRDVDYFKNYKIDKISAFNMFPRTKHVECIIVLNSV